MLWRPGPRRLSVFMQTATCSSQYSIFDLRRQKQNCMWKISLLLFLFRLFSRNVAEVIYIQIATFLKPKSSHCNKSNGNDVLLCTSHLFTCCSVFNFFGISGVIFYLDLDS